MQEIELVSLTLCLVVLAAYLELEIDGRSIPSDREIQRTVPTTFFQDNYALREDDSSFRSAFRVGRGCVERLCTFVTLKWPHYYNSNPDAPGRNRKFSLRQKVAITLSFLGSRGSMENVAQKFGASKATVSRAVKSIIAVLYGEREQLVFYPRNVGEWSDVAAGFEAIAGIPGIAGAVDGTLIRRTRPAAFWGWYCRKGFPAYNMMAIVDSAQRFLSFSVRPGSCNDQSVWNRSLMGGQVAERLPEHMHFLGDAGYALRRHMITPFPHESRSDPNINFFNKEHSRTRMAVEMAFGALKGRFQILRRELDMKSEQADGQLIAACVVLHNFCIHYETNTLDILHDVVAAEPRNSMTDEMAMHSEAENECVVQDDEVDPDLQLGRAKRQHIMNLLCNEN